MKITQSQKQNYVRPAIAEKFEFFSYGHALEILNQSFPEEWNDLQDCLEKLEIRLDDLRQEGGNKSPIPKKFDEVLIPKGWREMRITADLVIKKFYRQTSSLQPNISESAVEMSVLEGYIDAHNIDFIKNRVAFDLEWNSKDQTFDRDLSAIKTYFDCSLIDVGIIITRDESLNEIFRAEKDFKGNLLIKKYGASTTWIGKLLYRLDARRHGGCPVLAIAIRKECVKDYGNSREHD